MSIETGSYAEFSAFIHREVNATRVPVNGTIEITNRCPLDCAHCYNNLPMHDGEARSRELTTAEHHRVIDEIADLGCLWLLYTGGEIFARRDFLDIYRHAIRRGLLVTLFTNGTMVTETIADELVKWPPFSIEITLYGATRETYEALTGIPGSYDLCMRGIALLLERGLPLKLKTVAVSINKHEIGAMAELAETLGVEFKFDAMINPRIDCSSSPLAVRLTPEEIVSLDLDDPERIVAWQELTAKFQPLPVPEGQTPQLYDCGGGVNSFAIDPYGDMSICVLSHIDRYNVRDGSVRDGWNHYLRGVRQRPQSRPSKCTTCSLKSMCGMCPANGELENGDPETPVDFLCEVAHLRAITFDIPVRPHGDCSMCADVSRLRGTAAALRSGGAERIAAIAAAQPRPLVSSCGSGGCDNCSAGAGR
jgi:radical SAM protein with 4Fe4S-binding SPASM domain